MQKFDDNRILELLSEISNQTEGISGYLKVMNVLSPYDIDIIKNLYGQREKYITKLNNFCKSKHWDNFYSKNDLRWNEIYQPLMMADKSNLDTLKENLSIVGEKLRTILNKKSLLIYLK